MTERDKYDEQAASMYLEIIDPSTSDEHCIALLAEALRQDRAHLEEAAAILAITEDDVDWSNFDYREAYLERLDKWREAERVRQEKKGT